MEKGMQKENRKKWIKFGILSVLLPLLTGGIFYYIFCPDVTFVQELDRLLGVGERPEIIPEKTFLISFLRSFFFDFLWGLALTGALLLILHQQFRKAPGRILAICIAMTLGLGMVLEILQLLEIAPGTFDPWDILAEGLGAAAGTRGAGQMTGRGIGRSVASCRK